MLLSKIFLSTEKHNGEFRRKLSSWKNKQRSESSNINSIGCIECYEDAEYQTELWAIRYYESLTYSKNILPPNKDSGIFEKMEQTEKHI